MTKTNLLKCSVIALFLAHPLAAPALATTANFTTTVQRTLVTTENDGARFGGCMVQLANSPTEHGLDCNSGKWVSLSCSGTHTSKANAMRLLDSAQLAFVTGRNVQVYVDDSRKHDGWCFAYRVDVGQLGQ